jgi:hypothetical protein
MKWLKCVISLSFISSSFRIHVAAVDLICPDTRSTRKRDGTYTSRECNRYGIRGGNVSAIIERDRKEDKGQ